MLQPRCTGYSRRVESHEILGGEPGISMIGDIIRIAVGFEQCEYRLLTDMICNTEIDPPSRFQYARRRN